MKRQHTSLQCGVAREEITPGRDTPLYGGAGRKRSPDWVLDPLYARVLALEGDGGPLCVVSLDVLGLTQTYSDRIRSAAEALGFAREAVFIHATHTHAAPALGSIIYDQQFPDLPPDDAWIRGDDPVYGEHVVKRVAAAIHAARAASEPVSLASGRAIEGRVAFNRRAVTIDGHVTMPKNRWLTPLGPADYLAYLEGPIDPEVAAICFRTADLRMKAVLLHFSCHPVCVSSRAWYGDAKVISADWPGAWCRGVQELVGPDCVPLVLNGFSGNINPRDPYQPHPTDDHRTIGRRLTETTERLLQTVSFPVEDACRLGCTSEIVPIALREVDPDLLAAATARLGDLPGVQWTDGTGTTVDPAWGRAAGLLGVAKQRERAASIDYEVQALRIGDAALVGAMGEPFVEAQLAIKRMSPARRTLVAHNVHHYCGYLPTADAFRHPTGYCGHEVNTSAWAKLEPAALDKVTAGAERALEKLFGKPPSERT